MVEDPPSGEQKRPPVFRFGRCPTNAGSRFFKTARESGPTEQNGDFSGLQFQRAA